MFGFMKKSAPDKGADEADIDPQAAQLSAEIGALEQRLEMNARDGEAQKQLMVAYNRALSLFAKSRRHRDEIDGLFVKMDALRTLTRKSI